MAARNNIAVADGETVPVTHTFVPYGDVTEGLAQFLNRNISVPAASEILTLLVRGSAAKPEDVAVPGRPVQSRVTELRIRYPSTYLNSTTGLTMVDFIDAALVRFSLHPRSSDQRAKNLRTLVFNSLPNTIVQKAIDAGEPVW